MIEDMTGCISSMETKYFYAKQLYIPALGSNYVRFDTKRERDLWVAQTTYRQVVRANDTLLSVYIRDRKPVWENRGGVQYPVPQKA